MWVGVQACMDMCVCISILSELTQRIYLYYLYNKSNLSVVNKVNDIVADNATKNGKDFSEQLLYTFQLAIDTKLYNLTYIICLAITS